MIITDMVPKGQVKFLNILINKCLLYGMATLQTATPNATITTKTLRKNFEDLYLLYHWGVQKSHMRLLYVIQFQSV